MGLVVETLLAAAESPLPVLLEVDKDGSRCINSAGIAFKNQMMDFILVVRELLKIPNFILGIIPNFVPGTL